MTRRDVQLPAAYEDRIERWLAAKGASLRQPARLAEAVLRLSDHYIEKPDARTPWEKDWAQIAYAVYFFPLNYVKVRGVLEEARRRAFFAGIDAYTDFGSGVGTVPLAFADLLPGHFKEGLAIERADVPQQIYRVLAHGEGAGRLAWAKEAPRTAGPRGGHASVFSFSLTELPALPAWAKASEALVLIEPATSQDGRRLMELRKELLATGFHAWAPCTHQGACPLLAESGRDWCHDRVAWTPPAWFEELSRHLPMRNTTVTCSYLLARRQAPPAELARLARLTGDLRREKGASRQMVCRGPKREFLSWQHKHGEPPEWPRGTLVGLAPDILEKGSELRPTAGQATLAEEG